MVFTSQFSAKFCVFGLRKTPMSVTIKGPWADRDRERNDREEAKADKTEVEEAPVGPGPPITTFKSKRFS